MKKLMQTAAIMAANGVQMGTAYPAKSAPAKPKVSAKNRDKIKAARKQRRKHKRK